MDSDGMNRRFNNELRNNNDRRNINIRMITSSQQTITNARRDYSSWKNQQVYITWSHWWTSCSIFGSFDCWNSNSDQVEEIKRRKEYLYNTKRVKEKTRRDRSTTPDENQLLEITTSTDETPKSEENLSK